MFRLLVLALVAALAACASKPSARAAPAPLQPVAQLDLQRYSGKWYVIANIPYSAERHKVGAYVDYQPRADGKIDAWYHAYDRDFAGIQQKSEALAEVLDAPANARWRIQSRWPLWLDYVVLYVDQDYQHAVVGHPSRDYAWILARQKYLTDQTYNELVQKLAAQGYDESRVLKIPQRAEFIGAPGFQ